MGKLSKVSCALAVASLTSATLFAPVVGAHPVTVRSSATFVSSVLAMHGKHGGEGDEGSGGHFFFPFPSPPRTLFVQQVLGNSVTPLVTNVNVPSTTTCPLGYVLVGGGYTTPSGSLEPINIVTSGPSVASNGLN